MKRTIYLIPSMLALAACGSGPTPAPPAAAQAESKPAPASEPGVVTLDEKMTGREWIVVEQVKQGAAVESVRATGRLTTHEDSTWKVGSITDGRVVRVMARLGDRVTSGQILVKLHSHDVHEARAEHARAKGERSRSQAALALALRMRDRARKLFDLKAGSLEQVERAETELLAAQAAVQSAEVEVRRTEIHLIEGLQVDPDEPQDHKPDDVLHEEDLVPIKSPGAGTVLRRLVSEGSVVAAGQELLVVSDLSRLRLIASLGEQHLPAIRSGAPARIELAALPGRLFSGKVDRIGEEMDPQTRTAEVWITIAAAGQALKPEGYANVEILTGATRPGILIPGEAVQDIEGASSVFVQTGPRTFVVRPISLGERFLDRVEIRQGLSAGDRIVVKGSFLLKSQLLRSTLE
ncbi:MAG: efflux RND transporter periplasmic adaptor subunit [Acidobacteria bacterium]|nr:efflux RND transporter periplasmic adaptor subunit [Acidobacteriota bacterium]